MKRRLFVPITILLIGAGCRDAIRPTETTVPPAGPSAAPNFAITAAAEAICHPGSTTRSVAVTQEGDINENGVVCDLDHGTPEHPQVVTLDDIVVEVAP